MSKRNNKTDSYENIKKNRQVDNDEEFQRLNILYNSNDDDLNTDQNSSGSLNNSQSTVNSMSDYASPNNSFDGQNNTAVADSSIFQCLGGKPMAFVNTHFANYLSTQSKEFRFMPLRKGPPQGKYIYFL